MTESAIQGACEACGKTYRVPSAERTYPQDGSGDGGELLVKWSFRDEDDAWIVTGFRFP